MPKVLESGLAGFCKLSTVFTRSERRFLDFLDESKCKFCVRHF